MRKAYSILNLWSLTIIREFSYLRLKNIMFILNKTIKVLLNMSMLLSGSPPACGFFGAFFSTSTSSSCDPAQGSGQDGCVQNPLYVCSRGASLAPTQGWHFGCSFFIYSCTSALSCSRCVTSVSVYVAALSKVFA